MNLTLQNIFVSNFKDSILLDIVAFEQFEKFKIVHSSGLIDQVVSAMGLTEEQAAAYILGQLKNITTESYAMAYAGHQFGHWAGRLGDGRVINLGEINMDGAMQTIQVKGAGHSLLPPWRWICRVAIQHT